MKRIRIVVVSSLFPSSVRKQSGLFVRERMFRATDFADVEVVCPVPWFPGQGLIRLFKPNYRPMPAKEELQNGITVHFPRFFAFPAILRTLDGKMMSRAIYKVIKKIDAAKFVDVIDSHFTYPDGLAATEVGKKLGKPVTITLRGTELGHSKDTIKKQMLIKAWEQADQMICVSDSLKKLAVSLGAEPSKFTVVGNGVDTQKFTPISMQKAREKLGISADAKVLITVGGLVKRKGFHRVIDCLPELLSIYPNLVYLIVGGASAEGNIEQELRQQAKTLGVSQHVLFLGSMAPAQLSVPLSAADVFVLATANEGWANVILESMACGTPVIATDVGGNREVVANAQVGNIVPFDDHPRLRSAIDQGLSKTWDRDAVQQYAQDNHWDKRMVQLHTIFRKLAHR